MQTVTDVTVEENHNQKDFQMGKDINNDNSFMIRFRSSVILMAVAIASMVLGGYVLFGVILLISMIGLMELYRVVGVNKSKAGAVGYIFAVLYFVFFFIVEYFGDEVANAAIEINNKNIMLFIGSYFPLLIALFIVVLLAVYVLTFPKFNSEQITMVFFGFFYVAVTLSYILRVREMDCGSYTVWLIFIGSWGSDTMAYVVGRKLGKTKIAPKLSPKKSLEGLIGGIVGAALGSVVSQIGDMAASAIKRNKGIKDYGTLIPGHGGILDRFDSVIFIAPIVYWLLFIFI